MRDRLNIVILLGVLIVSPENLLYFTLLMAVWVIPSMRASLGSIWAVLFVCLHWLFVNELYAPPSVASATVGFSLLMVHFISSANSSTFKTMLR